MRETVKTKLMRWGFNLFPAYWGSGAHITYIADDWTIVRVELPLSWRTRNYVGTIYGGSMYGAVDPIFMVMLIRLLGPEYVVWDKEATIFFKRPGKSTLYAAFIITTAEVEAIIAELTVKVSLERAYQVDLVDAAGVVHATAFKTLYISHKDNR